MPSPDEIKKRGATAEEEELEFVVMPEIEADKRGSKRGNMLKKPAPPPFVPPPSATAVPAAPKSKREYWKILLVALAALVLAGAAYFAYARYYKDRGAAENLLPGIFVDEPEQGGEDADNDGLSDLREQELNTTATDPDSDGDGLADGDEINIYQSDPLLPDTDSDGFEDGAEVAKGFSPVARSSGKAQALELKTWQENIEKFGLHEPTKSTLKLKAEVAADEEPAVYSNAAFNYSFEVPAVFAYRESADRREVGIYIAGSAGLDPDFNTDPIFINTGVLTSGQKLRDWVTGQYSSDQYQKLTESKIGALPAITLEGVKSEPCAQTKTFVNNKSTVVVLTLTCEGNTAFNPYYQALIQSFKFTQ